MKTISEHTIAGFSMIEMVIVVVITGIVAAIAVPQFADAGSGRRLSFAKKTLIADIEQVKLRARATSKVHVIQFYPSENKYIIVEGTDVRREAIIFSRDFDDEPFNVEVQRTNLTGDQLVVVSAFGDLSPAFSVVILKNGTEIIVPFDGIGDLGIVPNIIISIDDVQEIDVKALGVIK